MTRWPRRLRLALLVRGKRTPHPDVDEAVHRFRQHHGDQVQAALLAYKLVPGKRGRLTEGPLRLVVIAGADLISADAQTGLQIGRRPVSDLTGYFTDRDGRVLVGFADPHENFPVVAAVHPVALQGSPDSSARVAGYAFLRCLLDAWEARTGNAFVNAWTGSSDRLDVEAW